MLRAKTFLIMEEKKILPRNSDWEEKYPLHPQGKWWKLPAGLEPSKKMQNSAEGGRLVWWRKSSCFKALWTQSLFLSRNCCPLWGERAPFGNPKAAYREKYLWKSPDLFILPHVMEATPSSRITANPGDGNPLPTDQTTVWQKPSHSHSPSMKSFNPV